LSIADIGKEISTRTQPLQQAIDNLSKQQQPFIELIRELPKKFDHIRQSQSQSDLIKEFSSKLDPLTQSIKAIKDGTNIFLFFLISIFVFLIQVLIIKHKIKIEIIKL